MTATDLAQVVCMGCKSACTDETLYPRLIVISHGLGSASIVGVLRAGQGRSQPFQPDHILAQSS